MPGLGQSLAHSHGLSRSFHGLNSLGSGGAAAAGPRATGLGGGGTWASVADIGSGTYGGMRCVE